MRIVVALGGNALLKRGERMSADAQRANVRIAAAQLAAVASGNDLVIVHGNGPQVGLLALQSVNTPQAEPFPLDVLDAQTEGMIGYMIEQELANLLPQARACATLLTMVEVDRADPAFQHPDKPIGPLYTQANADVAARGKGWTMARDEGGYRRVVPSPAPMRLLDLRPVTWLLEHGTIVICAGGGGIPVVVDEHGLHTGVEAVIDKDRSAAMLAHALDADLFVIATDVAAVYLGWDSPSRRPILRANPDAFEALHFASGSMSPKIEAACDFARRTGRRAVIGALADIEQLIAATAGTSISADQVGMVTGIVTVGASAETATQIATG